MKNKKKTNKKTLPKLFYYYFLLCQLKIVLLLEKVHECFINKKFPSEYGLSKLNGWKKNWYHNILQTTELSL